jgi:hypothetical protein
MRANSSFDFETLISEWIVRETLPAPPESHRLPFRMTKTKIQTGGKTSPLFSGFNDFLFSSGLRDVLAGDGIKRQFDTAGDAELVID